MGIFGNKESKEEKRNSRIQTYMELYGLTDLNDYDKKIIGSIAGMDTGNLLMDLGTTLSGSVSDGEKLISSKMDMLIAQNWMIIRKLESLNKK